MTAPPINGSGSRNDSGDLHNDFAPAPLPQAELDDAQRLACLRLIRSKNVGPITFRELINHFGGAQAAINALPDLYQRGGEGSGTGRRQIAICPQDRALSELASAARQGAKPVFTIEPGYPAALAHIETAPPMLYVKGKLDLLARPAIGIVGSRNSSSAGITLARQFASELGRNGYAIISGLARGIDGAAHLAALETGTIAVVAGGIDVIYPPEHEALYHDITQQGCIISEMPPGFKPRGRDFPRRNRIISGCALGVIIIEAARRSGTLITARMAAEQGREVFAVPGHPLDPRSEGTNHLLKTGATLATCPADVMETLNPMLGGAGNQAGHAHLLEEHTPMQPPTAAAAAAANSHNARPVVVIEDRQRNLVTAALSPVPININDLARTTDLPVRAVQVALMELDLGGRIERHGEQLVSLRPTIND